MTACFGYRYPASKFRSLLIAVIAATIFAVSPSVAADIGGQITKPDGNGPFPAVVLLHSCEGLKGPVVDHWPQVLNRMGYATYSHNTFDAIGFKQPCSRRKIIENARARIGDALSALDVLAAQKFVDPSRIAVIGFSLGGITVTDLAGRNRKSPDGHRYSAAAAVYGHCTTLQRRYSGQTSVPLAIILGNRERSDYLNSCTWLAGNDNIDLHVLPGVYHGFDDPRNREIRKDPVGNEMLYDSAALEKTETILKAFLAKHLAK